MRRSKRRLLKLSKACTSPKADDEVSTIATDPINMADAATTLAAPPVRGIIIMEPELERPSPKVILEGKGKKKQKETSVFPFEDSTPLPL